MKTFFLSAMTGIAIVLGISSIGANCKAPSAATITTDIAGEVLCVVQHDTLPPAQIVSACVGLALADVEAILAADMSTTKWKAPASQSDAGK